MNKRRLDQLVFERGLAPTKSKAQAFVLAGEILVDGKKITKAGHQVSDEAEIRMANPGPKYVSRGGIKLAGALDRFQIDPKGWRCLDVGASTGGFTDCLLQRGAEHVFTIDVGRGQLDAGLRADPRVTWKESFHAEELKPDLFGRPVDLAVADVSFISLKKVLPFVVPCIRESGILLALIKPQFEASKKEISKGGVLRDETKRLQILSDMAEYAKNELSLENVAVADAVITGPKGNREAFLFGRKTA